MQTNRMHKAKLNMVTTLLRQLMATLCGIVIPRVMIGAFGSVAYGATTSIAQFLSYISLLEAGIGRVARGALYRPLAEGNIEQTSGVYYTVKRFFRNVGLIFLAYTVVLAIAYYDIADTQIFSRQYTFGLVIAISLSTMATYFGGITNMTLMHADQKQYLTNAIITITNLLNTLCIVCLVWMDADILTVKLVSSIIFIARPVLYAAYVKRQYKLVQVKTDDSLLSQKWTGIGQHIAYFLHTNTDVVMLTLLSDLKMVAVYSVYHLVVNSIWNIASAFSGGMEAAFGSMLAEKDHFAFVNAYRYYKFILTFVSLVLFGCTGVLIVPFIKLYMAGVTDANYIQPLFALVLVLAEAMNALSLPCSTIPTSANMLKHTKWGSYGEAIINITLSLVLIHWNPLLGVALGTFCATLFKSVYYMTYVGRNILKDNVKRILLQFFLSIGLIAAMSFLGMYATTLFNLGTYFAWFLFAIFAFMFMLLIAVGFCRLFFTNELAVFWKRKTERNSDK